LNRRYLSTKDLRLILLVAILTLLVSTGLSLVFEKLTIFNIPSVGNIKTVGVQVYWNENLESTIDMINWGVLWLGSSKTITFFIKSISNVVTTLELNTTDWNPEYISNFMDLTWDYNGSKINPGEVIQIEITLSTLHIESFKDYILTNDINDFNFNIIIKAVE